MPDLTPTDVTQKEDSHALPATPASPDAPGSAGTTVPEATDPGHSSAESMSQDVSASTVQGSAFYIDPAEPVDLMASYDANGRLYEGWGWMLSRAGRSSGDENPDQDPDLSLGYPPEPFLEDSPLDHMDADERSDGIDPDWVVLSAQADTAEMVEYPPVDAPGYAMASHVLNMAFLIGASLGWGFGGGCNAGQ